MRLLSRHPTHRAIRKDLPRLPFPVLVRLGSRTKLEDAKKLFNFGKEPIVELNTPEGVANAADKLKMKQCFEQQGIKTAKRYEDPKKIKSFPIVAKHRMGSRGTGVYKLDDKHELTKFLQNRNEKEYIFEAYKPYNREYRCHTWEDGIFYTCRKARRRGIPTDQKWKFNYEHTVWLKETNPNFNKPKCWPQIEEECKKAVAACGLTFGGCDVKVNRDGTKFFVLEINSAPSFGDTTSEKYIEMLPIMARREKDKQ